MPDYLQKRRRRWYAVMEIPKALKAKLGKPRFVKSLETESLAVAKRRVGPIVSAWMTELDRARAPGGEAGDAVRDDARFFRQALRRAATPEERDQLLEEITDAADAIAYEDIDIGQPLSSSVVATRFFGEATGWHAPTLENLDEWLSAVRTSAKTRDMQRADVQRFAAQFPILSDVQRPQVRRWVISLMNEDGLSPKTVQRILSALRGYWRFLQTINAVAEDRQPFTGLEVAREAKRAAPEIIRQPFEPADVPRLLAGAIGRGDDGLADLIRLGMWTGCRIEELCALKATDVAGDRFKVREAKSTAGIREVPVHAEL
ncbi:MAG: site-specific integrase, partial [Rhodospirillales bacterium]|nr:site-specific integrase [Rhodospirillales bacterium]